MTDLNDSEKSDLVKNIHDSVSRIVSNIGFHSIERYAHDKLVKILKNYITKMSFTLKLITELELNNFASVRDVYFLFILLGIDISHLYDYVNEVHPFLPENEETTCGSHSVTSHAPPLEDTKKDVILQEDKIPENTPKQHKKPESCESFPMFDNMDDIELGFNYYKPIINQPPKKSFEPRRNLEALRAKYPPLSCSFSSMDSINNNNNNIQFGNEAKESKSMPSLIESRSSAPSNNDKNNNNSSNSTKVKVEHYYKPRPRQSFGIRRHSEKNLDKVTEQVKPNCPKYDPLKSIRTEPRRTFMQPLRRMSSLSKNDKTKNTPNSVNNPVKPELTIEKKVIKQEVEEADKEFKSSPRAVVAKSKDKRFSLTINASVIKEFESSKSIPNIKIIPPKPPTRIEAEPLPKITIKFKRKNEKYMIIKRVSKVFYVKENFKWKSVTSNTEYNNVLSKLIRPRRKRLVMVLRRVNGNYERVNKLK